MPTATRLTAGGVSLPHLLYGTAWKEDDTERLARLALDAGFRGIDTANQRKHYHEAGVGAAIAGAVAAGVLTRDELFLQTKFTHVDGQDHRLPYDRAAPVATQVAQSFVCSLEHLRVAHLDAYVLHGPLRRRGLDPLDWEAWRAMEEVQRDGRARLLGVSNVALEQLEELHAFAAVKPAFVQNRCYASAGWDRDVRRFCRANGVVYQGFSLLTANPEAVKGRAVRAVAERVGATPAQVVFRFAMEVGMLPLTGTSSPAHMREDLAAADLALSADDVAQIERAGAAG